MKKAEYYRLLNAGQLHKELNTVWRFLGFHLILSLQKKFQKEEKTKGNTILIFDNEERERARFTDLIINPSAWSDLYYDKSKNQKRLDQIVDVPYFADSKEVSLIQVADFVAFFLRRYLEIKDNHIEPKYLTELEVLGQWMMNIAGISIGRTMI